MQPVAWDDARLARHTFSCALHAPWLTTIVSTNGERKRSRPGSALAPAAAGRPGVGPVLVGAEHDMRAKGVRIRRVVRGGGRGKCVVVNPDVTEVVVQGHAHHPGQPAGRG
jgi:hypothetical protein